MLCDFCQEEISRDPISHAFNIQQKRKWDKRLQDWLWYTEFEIVEVGQTDRNLLNMRLVHIDCGYEAYAWK